MASPAQAAAVPYTDTRVIGYIGLCDASGQAVTSGSTATLPFVAKAVNSSAAPNGYNGKGSTATLFAYQPRQGVDPGNWSGEQLTGSSQFTNPAHPATVSTLLDSSLADFVSDFPPKWDGLIQLRMYLGAPEQSAYSAKYDATDIQVSGSSWKVVQGGASLCAAGSATSNENALIPQSLASASASAAHAAALASASANATATASAAGSGSSTAPASADSTPRSTDSSSSSGSPSAAASSSTGHGGGATATLVGLVAVVVVAIGGGAYWWWRRQQATQ